MIANIGYMFSTFADYTPLSYNKQDVMSVLGASDDPTLAPSLAQEILPNGLVLQRMNFTGRGGALTIAVSSGRINVSIAPANPSGFAEEEINTVRDLLIRELRMLYSVFGDRAPLPTRLAWNTSYVCLGLSDEEDNAYRGKFLKRLHFFEKDRLEDTIVRLGARRDVDINHESERLNVIATINNYSPDPVSNPDTRGYRVDYDLNTWQGNVRNRFVLDSLDEFANAAIGIQQELNREILPC